MTTHCRENDDLQLGLIQRDMKNHNVILRMHASWNMSYTEDFRTASCAKNKKGISQKISDQKDLLQDICSYSKDQCSNLSRTHT